MAPHAARNPSPGDTVANEAMTRYAGGDASAFPVLYDQLAPRIIGLVKRRLRDPSRIEDVVQQTFERIHRARGTFMAGADVLSWAFTIARNLCLDLGAQGWREHVAENDDETAPLAQAVAEIVDPERAAMARERVAQMVSAFGRLPVNQQLALELVRVEGFTMAAAAENLGVTLASIKMSVFRGAAALRAMVRGDAAIQPRPSATFSQLSKEQLHGVT